MHPATFTARCLTVVLALLLAACGDGIPTHVDFQIDNPTEATITVKIDDETYEIAPNTSEEVTLATGLHRLQSALTGEVDFMVYGLKGSRGVLMNPTFSSYVLMREIYSTGEEGGTRFGAFNRTISLDGVEYTGNFEPVDGLFINRSWRFDLDEDFPEELVIYDERSGSIADKLFRKLDFVRYFEANYDEEGRYQAQHQPPAAPVASYPDLSTLHVFNDADLEAATQPLKQLCAAYLATTDPAEATRLHATYFDLQMAFTSTSATKGSELDDEDNEAYNGFVMAVSSLMSTQARVLPAKS